MTREHHEPGLDSIISLSQSDRERRLLWERADVSAVSLQEVEEIFGQNKHFSLPSGTRAILRIGYSTSVARSPSYFDLGEVKLEDDTEVALDRSPVHLPSEEGAAAVFTLDSQGRRELYQSGQGREALEEEKTLARRFMDKRKNYLRLRDLELRAGLVTKVQLITRVAPPKEV